MSDLREYIIRSDRTAHGGWAIIVLSLERCYFSTVSDFGNYAFCWGSGPGMEFRRFLMQVHEDYLGGKLMSGWPNRDEYDGNSTRRRIFEYLRGIARESFEGRHGMHGKKRFEFYTRERTFYRRARRDGGDFWSQGDFDEWYRESHIGDAYELRGEVLNRQFQGFYKHVWPQFVELLKAELATEEKPKEVTA